MASFKYWDDCVDAEDMEAMWMDPQVKDEWINAGEDVGSKVHLSRDPDGQPYLTQTEMKAVAGIIVRRHFVSEIESDMICAIAELESDRQLLPTRYNKKTKEITVGIMQIVPKTAEWLFSELGYQKYEVQGDSKLLHKPFVNIYFGAAYLKWLSNYDQKPRSEEFMVRAYKGGIKKATRKVTLPHWRRYLSVKESLPSRKVFEVVTLPNGAPAPVSGMKGLVNTTWDSRASPEDMEAMWNHPVVNKEWTKSGEKRGKVRLSHDTEKRPYVSRAEMRAVAEIILMKHFLTKDVKPTVLCAVAEIVSARFVNGVKQRAGLMGIDFPTACWLSKELGYNAYTVESVEDLTKPFVSVYFGAAYMAWLSTYEGRERTPQFVVQAYVEGPKNANVNEAGPVWLKFKEAIAQYEEARKEQEGSCAIL
ncbi:hypothetical protein LguiB_035807 [Lonicera macranthoides]